MPIPLVIDTDTAQDDCVAILVGLLDPEADLKAITMVAGNVGFDQQVRNAFLTMSVAGGSAMFRFIWDVGSRSCARG